MILIIGGAYQGKYEYARAHYNEADIINRFHLEVLTWIRHGITPETYIKEHLADYADKVIVCDDISCGVVPTDPTIRRWREELGRVLAVLAAHSDQVYRLFCGIATSLKTDAS